MAEEENDEARMLYEGAYGVSSPMEVQFYLHAVRDKQASDEQKAPVYVETPFAKIRRKNERDCISVPVEDRHIEQYPREWREFEKRSQRQFIPLAALPKMRPPIRLALEELGFRDVDDLIAGAVPDYLKPWQNWARQIKAIHDGADNLPESNVTPIEKAKRPRGRPRTSHAKHVSDQSQSSAG